MSGEYQAIGYLPEEELPDEIECVVLVNGGWIVGPFADESCAIAWAATYAGEDFRIQPLTAPDSFPGAATVPPPAEPDEPSQRELHLE